MSTIYGGTGNDNLSSGNVSRIVYAGDGNDTVNTGNLIQHVYAGDGNDTINGSDDYNTQDVDRLYGGDGDDVIRSGFTGSTGYYGDLLYGGSGSDRLYGGTARDLLYGGNDSDVLYGGDGSDTLDAGNGNDTLFGGDGSDQVIGWTGTETLYAGAGSDTLFGGVDADTLYAGAGDDDVVFGVGDTVYGDDGDDHFFNYISQGMGGTATIIGGEGGAGDSDTSNWATGDALRLDYDDDLGWITANLIVTFSGDEAGIASSGTSNVIFSEIEQIWTGNGHDRIDASNDTVGTTLVTFGGSDVVYGGSGGDLVYAGSGISDRIYSGAGSDTVYGGTDNDFIYGGSGEDALYGGSGQDWFYSTAGNDTYFGGSDLDRFRISDGSGNDSIDGGTGFDIIQFETSTAVTMTATDSNGGTATYGSTTITWESLDSWDASSNNDIADFSAYGSAMEYLDWGGNDTVTGTNFDDWFANYGSGNFSVSAGAGNDYIEGADGADTFDGGAGNDEISGNDGADVLDGGSGNDIIYGGDDGDTIRVTDGFGTDTIYGGEGGTDSDTLDLSALGLGVTITYTGEEQGTFTDGTDTVSFFGIEDILLSDQNDNLDGSASTRSMTINGLGGSDTIEGGDEDDLIYGGSGHDSIIAESSDAIGYGGSDTFYGGSGNDTIRADYEHNRTDTLFGGSGDDILYDANGGHLLYGGDGQDRLYETQGGGTGGSEEADTLYGGDGNDYLEAATDSAATAVIDGLFGGTGNDTLVGGTGIEHLYGGDGVDLIVLRDDFGTDVLYGGEAGTDFDSIDLGALGAGVTVTYTGDEQGTISDNIDAGTFFEIEDLSLTDQNDDLDASNDTLGINAEERDGNDTLAGGSGADELIGGAGDDTINGGAGDDILDGRNNLIFNGNLEQSDGAGFGTLPHGWTMEDTPGGWSFHVSDADNRSGIRAGWLEQFDRRHAAANSRNTGWTKLRVILLRRDGADGRKRRHAGGHGTKRNRRSDHCHSRRRRFSKWP